MFDNVRITTMKHSLAHDRHAELRRLLAAEGTVAVATLAQKLSVSEMTVRRDLRELEGQGALARVHGGAVAGASLRFGSRLAQHQREKSAAARKLLTYLPERGAIYLDGSTTVYHLAEQLAKREGLLVATNNLDTFLRVQAYPGCEALLIGGSLNRDTDNFVGRYAQRVLDGLAFDVAFFSAYALDAQVGPSEPAVSDAEVKEAVCARARRVCVAVNSHKLGSRVVGTWSFERQRAVLATELDPTADVLEPYHARFATIC
jgi:DeoR family transcriptional regulator, fructose operon transcriptional repressor